MVQLAEWFDQAMAGIVERLPVDRLTGASVVVAVLALALLAWLLLPMLLAWRLGVSNPKDRVEIAASYRAAVGKLLLLPVLFGSSIYTLYQASQAARQSARTEYLQQYAYGFESLQMESPGARVGGVYAIDQLIRSGGTVRAPLLKGLAVHAVEHRPRGTNGESQTITPDAQAVFDVLTLRPREEPGRETRFNLAKGQFRGLRLPEIIDSTGARLRAQFVEANLYRADLSASDLYRASFYLANLRYANLDGANLTECDFTKAGLYGATLCHDRNLAAPVLQDGGSHPVQAWNAAFYEADARNAWFPHAKLAEAQFGFARLDDAHFEYAILDKASFGGASMQGVHARGAVAKGAEFVPNAGVPTVLVGADFSFADLSGARFDRANLTGADFTGANLEGATLREAALGGAKLDGARICATVMPNGELSHRDCDAQWKEPQPETIACARPG